MYDKIKHFFQKYKQTVICLSVLIILWLLFEIFNNFVLKDWQPFLLWIHNDHGNVADWADSVGTIAAFLVVFWQVRKQGNIERAIHVEESRPRFSILFAPKLCDGTKVLYWNKDNLTNILNNNTGYRFITLQNVSKNVVYDFSVVLRYHTVDNSYSRTDYWSTTGVFPGEIIAFVPKFKGTGNDSMYIYDEFIVRFTTPANEVGFFQMTNTNNVKGDAGLYGDIYYFVKGKNLSGVKAINQDKMIKINSNICKRFDAIFNAYNYSTNTYKVPKEK